MKFKHVIEVQKNQRIIEIFLFMKEPRISLSLEKAEALFTGRDHIATKKIIVRKLKSENATTHYKKKWIQFSTVHIMQRRGKYVWLMWFK